MKRLEVSGAVRLIYRSLGFKGLIQTNVHPILCRIVYVKCLRVLELLEFPLTNTTILFGTFSRISHTFC